MVGCGWFPWGWARKMERRRVRRAIRGWKRRPVGEGPREGGRDFEPGQRRRIHLPVCVDRSSESVSMSNEGDPSPSRAFHAPELAVVLRLFVQLLFSDCWEAETGAGRGATWKPSRWIALALATNRRRCSLVRAAYCFHVGDSSRVAALRRRVGEEGRREGGRMKTVTKPQDSTMPRPNCRFRHAAPRWGARCELQHFVDCTVVVMHPK